MREKEFSIYKRLSERWKELTESVEGAKLFSVWVDELDHRLNVDMLTQERLDLEARGKDVLTAALRVLRAALEAANAEGVREVKALALRLHAPVYGTIPEEAGLFDTSPERLEELDPNPRGDPEGWFEKVWWHPWLIRSARLGA